MTKVNITQLLDGQFHCPSCHASSQNWTPMARVLVRQYSRIYRLRCAHCGEQIVAKVLGGRFSSEDARLHARKEYEALCELQSTFPQDEQYGTLAPLGHLEHAGHGIVITRLAGGVDLVRYLRTLDAAGVQAGCRSSGVWLKKLHESGGEHQQKGLGTADKIAFLADTYGEVLRRDRKIVAACTLLAQEGSQIDAVAAVAVRHHGDFKPDNVLCDGTRYVGLDIGWHSTGAAVYDLAPFLNHLWLAGRAVTGSRIMRLYDLAESAFLSGYGDVGEMRALRWAQLYFSLCYMGDYCQQGRLASHYANWKGWPLVRRLSSQLEAAA